MPRRAEVWRLLQAPPLGLGELPSLCFVPLLLLCDAWLRARAYPARSGPCIWDRTHRGPSWAPGSCLWLPMGVLWCRWVQGCPEAAVMASGTRSWPRAAGCCMGSEAS